MLCGNLKKEVMEAEEDHWLNPFGDVNFNPKGVPLDDMGDPPMDAVEDHYEELETPVAYFIPTEIPTLILVNVVSNEFLYFLGGSTF